ncbi:bromo adjacent homology domain-containing 1 protein-like [Seriola lalandi dorsalis]|uniref:bromo adjacent homology domain-containing 1 protein-like n=1 Tax=Seriola lalandi dorsalis TaxID=1841481 RepID=UPI000C6FA80C|nr:bromo adjacent homology domain-containing 1 protein-like [Seriola lalandi dorsalis]
MGRTRLPQKQPSPVPSLSSTKQKKVSRRRATNGWRPVGIPTEREVFIAGEDETALRQCYEGVERDGEVIHVRDTVLLRSGPRKKSLPYVAKISALWEDPKTGELMMSLFWYYRPEHTQGGRDPSAHCEVRLEWNRAKI